MPTKDLPVSLIRNPRILLRPVRRDSIEYVEVYDSVATHGILSSVTVRPMAEPDFELVAGMNRLDIARRLQHETIPATIKSMTADEALSIQLQENVCRIDASRLEIARQLLRIQQTRPGISVHELARLAGKCTKWVKAQLELLDLSPTIQSRIDNGDMPVMNAYELLRLPPRLREAEVDRAIIMQRSEFKDYVTEKVLDVSDKPGRGGVPASEVQFSPHPYMRSMKEVNRDWRDECIRIDTEKPNLTYKQGWQDSLAWIMHMDPTTLARRRAQFEERLNAKPLTQEARQ